MLTKKQKELYDFLDHYIKSNQISPSFEEMKKAVNLKSKSGIHRLITSLEQRGFIKRLKHKARAMEITKKLYQIIQTNHLMKFLYWEQLQLETQLKLLKIQMNI